MIVFGCIFLTILLSVFLEKYKKYHLAAIIIVVVLSVVMGANDKIADASIYSYRFDNASEWAFSDSQWAMSLFMFICRTLGLSYIQFRILYFAIGLSIILFVVSRFTNKISWFLLLYITYTMMIDSAQMKNFMAMCFLSLALYNLVRGDIKGNFMFLLFCLIAAGFQIVAYAYLPLIVFTNTALKRRYRVLACFPVVLFAVLFSNKYTSSFISSWLLAFLQGDILNRSAKFLSSTVNNGFLVYFLATFAYIVFAYIFKTQIDNEDVSAEDKKLSDIMFLCSLYLLMFLPFYFFAQDFSRLLRNFVILMDVVFIVNLVSKNSIRTEKKHAFRIKKKNLVNFGYVLFMIYLFYWDIAVYWNTVVIPLFNNNLYLH